MRMTQTSQCKGRQEMSAYLLLLSITISKFITKNAHASISIIDKGILPLEKDSVAIQLFLDIENRDPARACKVTSNPIQCCLNNPKEAECSPADVYGAYKGLVRAKDRETIIYILPSLYQHDQFGYCSFNLGYECNRGKRFKRKTVEIVLDTRIRNKKSDLLIDYIGDRVLVTCDSVDQNSLDDCDSDCDLKYLGAKSFYNNDINRCTEVTDCEGDLTKELPDVVYIADINMCRDYNHPITLADIYAITTRMGVVTELPKYKQRDSIELKSNCSTISQNLFLLRDMLNGKLCRMTGGSDYGKCCKAAIISIFKCIGIICMLLLGFIFLFSIIMWLWKKWSDGDFENFCTFTRSHPKPKPQPKRTDSAVGYVNTKVRNDLLKDVIVRDVPIELRDSIVNICDRIGEDVRQKRRYRSSDLGSQVSLNRGDGDTSEVSTDTCDSAGYSDDEKRLLVKRRLNKNRKRNKK